MVRPTAGADDIAAEELRAIEQFLQSIAGRLRLERAIRSVCYSLICSSAAILMLRILAYILAFPYRIAAFSPSFTAIVFLVPVAVILGFSLTKRYDLMLIARFTDERLGLKDRLATALSSRLSVMEPSFASHIARDAKQRIDKIDPQAVVPFRFSIWHWSAAAVLLVTVFAITAPQSPISVHSSSYRQFVMTTTREQIVGKPKQPFHAQAELMNESAGRVVPASAAGGSAVHASPPTHSAVDGQKKSVLASAASDIARLLGRLSSKPGHNGQGNENTSDNGTEAGGRAASGSKSAITPGGSNDAGRIPTLGDKLRQFADRLAQRTLTSGEQQDAAHTVDSINHKLDNLQMPKTQQKLSSATQELNGGEQNEAIADIRSAAYFADHEGAVVPPGQVQGAVGRNTVAIPARQGSSNGSNGSANQQSNGQESSSGSGSSSNQQSNGQGSSGQPNVSESGGQQAGGASGSGSSKNDSGSVNATGGHPQDGQSGAGYGGGAQKPRFGAPRLIDPAKLGAGPPASPIALPLSNPSGRSSEKQGTQDSDAASASSTVPYLPGHQVYKTTPEHAATSEEIPPSYRNLIRQYFSAPIAVH